jgi:dephospho-CoA kinase
MAETKIIGITGGIGSGKSSVIDYIESKGHIVLKMDDMAKELMISDKSVIAQIKKKFGDEAYTDDGKVNSAYISGLVFGNTPKADANLLALNGIVHPVVIEKMIAETEKYVEQEVPFVFIESALIYELDLEDGFDYVICVYSDENVCIDRIMQRGKLTKDQAENRLRAQMNPQHKKSQADFVIDNNASLEELYKATELTLMFIA